MPPWILRQIDVAEKLKAVSKAKAKPKAKAAVMAQRISKWLPKNASSASRGPAVPMPAEPASSSTDPMPMPREPASSSTDIPTAPPASGSLPPAEAESRETGSRKRSYLEQICEVEDYGSIHFYPNAQNFVAFCRAAGHQDCRKSRTCKAAVTAARHGQGRPLGMLAQWLFNSREHATREGHQAGAVFAQSERLAARQRFLKLPGAEAMARNERPPEEGEGEEPSKSPSR